jgi:cell wall-associated NlpC family hydrolase
MTQGICHLSVAPVRVIADNAGEMCTQLLYGDQILILEKRKAWSRVKVVGDESEGWVCNNQYTPVSEKEIDLKGSIHRCTDLVSFSSTPQDMLIPVLLGSSVDKAAVLGHHFEGNTTLPEPGKSGLVSTALLYLNAPFLWGGKTPFGIDCSGLTQMVYRIHGHQLKRQAAEQATQGEPLSFIEESEAGDLAVFDNREGEIDHVGIIMKDNYIIHAYGKVKIDRLDHTGIFNTELGRYTHPLRVIKKMI